MVFRNRFTSEVPNSVFCFEHGAAGFVFLLQGLLNISPGTNITNTCGLQLVETLFPTINS